MISPRVVGIAAWIVLGMPQPRIRAAAVPAGPLETRVTVDVREAPLTTFLDTLSEQAKINFIIKESLDKERVTAALDKVTVREALYALIGTKGLRYRRLGNSQTYVIERKTAKKTARFDCGDIPKTRVSVRVREASLDDFIRKIGSQAKINFVLAEGVGKRSVTADLKEVTAAEALAIVLEVKELSCRRDSKSGAYLIGF